MSIELAGAAYLAVHALGIYLLRASGTWRVLLAPVLPLAPDKTPDPLKVAPRGWIENHSFWDLPDGTDQTDAAEDDEQVFWGGHQRETG